MEADDVERQADVKTLVTLDALTNHLFPCDTSQSMLDPTTEPGVAAGFL